MARLVFKNEILDDHVHELPVGITLLGRSKECDLQFFESGVSRFQSRVTRSEDGEVSVEDLGSSNGTWVNGERIEGARVLASGDDLRFGNVPALFEVDAAPAAATPPTPPLAPAATARDAPSPAPSRGLPAPLKGVLGLAILGLGIWLGLSLLGEKKQDEQPALPPLSGSADAETPPSDGREERPEAPLESVPDEKPGPASGSEVETPPKPAPERVPTPAADLHDFVLNGGRRLRASLLAEDPIAFRVRRADGPVESLSKDTIESFDGRPYILDVAAFYTARLEAADSVEELLSLARWCHDRGLRERRDTIARRILVRTPSNRQANAWLGRFRYRGGWKDRAELVSLGALGADGSLIGTARDLQRISRLYHATRGRPPLPKEREHALSTADKDLVQELAFGPEFHATWLGAELRDLCGSADLGPLKAPLNEACEGLAHEGDDFVSVWRDLLEHEGYAKIMVGPEEASSAILRQLLGFDPKDDPELFLQAAKMWSGQRVAILGDRGESAEELIDIVLRQPQFYRRTLENFWLRLRGAPVDESAIVMQSFALGTDRSQLERIVKEWLSASLEAENPRAKSAAELAAGLWLHATGTPPPPGEHADATAFLDEFGPRELAQPLLAATLCARGALAPPAPDRRGLWLQEQWRSILGRVPTTEEISQALPLLETDGGHRRLLVGLLSRPEFQEL